MRDITKYEGMKGDRGAISFSYRAHRGRSNASIDRGPDNNAWHGRINPSRVSERASERVQMKNQYHRAARTACALKSATQGPSVARGREGPDARITRNGGVGVPDEGGSYSLVCLEVI